MILSFRKTEKQSIFTPKSKSTLYLSNIQIDKLIRIKKHSIFALRS